MTSSDKLELQQEWIVLHQGHEHYEHFALLIKMLAIALVSVGYFLFSNSFVLILLVLVLWGQESIWKTYQGRTAARLIALEEAMLHADVNAGRNGTEPQSLKGFQFYSDWQANRGTNTGLVGEYLSYARKPTVAFPYLLLLLIVLAN